MCRNMFQYVGAMAPAPANPPPIDQLSATAPVRVPASLLPATPTPRTTTLDLPLKVPLANMFQYVSSLRSLSKGRASYVMELDSYEIVPPNVEKELLAKYTGNTGEEDDE